MLIPVEMFSSQTSIVYGFLKINCLNNSLYNIAPSPIKEIFEYLLNSSSSLSIKVFKGFNEIFPLESFKERKVEKTTTEKIILT